MKKIWTDAMLARRRQGKKKNNTRQDKEKERIKMHYHHLYTNQEEDLIASSSSTRQLDENKHGATKILDQCILQPGIHHTNMAMITWMGQPLRQDKCPFPLHIQWFRALNDHDDFKIIPNAKEEWFTPIADDIGTRLLAKIMLQEENVFKTKMLEYGPIKEDPHVRSHVEHFLEQKTALFMGLLSLQVQAQEENEEEMMDNDEVVLQEPKELKEKWTLFMDENRVRVTCETLLIPPFESLYSPQLKVEILRETPNEFIIYFSKETFVHLCAVSNAMRDIIVLTLRAFCSFALSKSTSMPEIHATITTKRVSPIRQSSQKNVKSLKEEEQEEEEQQQEQQAMYYALPWDTSTSLHSCSTSVSIFDNGIHGGHVHDLGPPVVQEIIYTQEDKALSDLLLQVEALLLHANDTNSQSNTENLSTSASGRYQISIKDIPELEIVDIPSSTSSLGTHSTMICPDLMNSQEEVKIEEEEIKNEFILPVNNQEVEQDKEKEEMNHLKAYYTQVFCALLTQLKTYKRHTNSAKDQIQLLKEQKKDLEKDLKIFQSACCCSSSSSSSTSLDSGWI